MTLKKMLKKEKNENILSINIFVKMVDFATKNSQILRGSRGGVKKTRP